MREILASITKKDLDLETFSAGGKGGQNQNRRSTGVRIRHRDSGAVGEARDSRSQNQNRKAALQRMVEHPKFKRWLNEKAFEARRGERIEEAVERQMSPENLKVEYQTQEGWKDERLSSRSS